MQQQRALLVSSDASALPVAERMQPMHALVTMCVWAAKRGHSSLSDQVAFCFAHELPQSQHDSLSVLSGAEVRRSLPGPLGDGCIWWEIGSRDG